MLDTALATARDFGMSAWQYAPIFRRRSLAVLVATASLVWQRAAGAEQPEQLEPVTVTAPRVAADAQQTPASITVLDEGDLAAAGIDRTTELGVHAPNLIVRQEGDRSSNIFSMRGFGNTGFGESSVGLYVDGIPYTDQRGTLLELYDIDAVEVFRGPQNVRFGRSADAGAIDVLTHAPGKELSGRASVTYGNFDTQLYRGAIDGPLGTDRVRFSLAGVESRREGYIRNTFLHEPLDNRDLAAGRGRLIFLPFPTLQVSVTGEAQRADDGSKALSLLGQRDPFRVAYDHAGGGRLDAYLGALRAVYTGSAFRLTSVTSCRSYDLHDNTFDSDFTPRDLMVGVDDHRFVDWTEELRLVSPDPHGRWRWQLGGFLEDKVTEPHSAFRLDSTPLVQAPPPAGAGLPFTAPVTNVLASRQHGRTWAGFGELTISVTERVEVTADLRYQRDEREMARTHVLTAPAQRISRAVVPRFRLHTTADAWLPGLTVGYRVRPSVLLYSNVTRGYRPGGFVDLVDDPREAQFAPQREWSYEAGIKASWLEGRLTSNLALFYVVAHDFQVVQETLAGFTVVNADRVTSRGLDLDLLASPVKGVDVIGSIGYVDARYDAFHVAGTPRRFDGNPLQLVPPYDASIALEYRHPRGPFARAEYQALAGYPFFQNNVQGQSAYELVGGRVGYARGRFEVSVWGKNLADTTYFPFAVPGGPGGRLVVVPGDPRTVGMTVRTWF